MKLLTSTVLSLVILAACGDKPEATVPKPVARPFEGQSISVIVPTLDARLIRGPILDEVAGFEARTGAKVRVLTPGWSETIEKIDQSLKSPDANFDIYVAISMWSGTLLSGDYIAPVPEAIKQRSTGTTCCQYIATPCCHGITSPTACLMTAIASTCITAKT
ncbi:MAG: hypothetical protein IPN53_17370 [Comamonadaceae bacterium]|nr:hypothetical protein [Comamonadaceae bacterium]